MEQYREMLSGAQLSIISAEPDLDGVAHTIVPSVRAGSGAELAVALRRLADCCDGVPVLARTLDLFGHSTARDGLLRLGDWVIDADKPDVAAWFRALADAELLPRLGIRALRLLACRTSATERGRATICTLAEILGLEVYGTPHLLYDAHHNAHGFRVEWEFLLVGSRELARSVFAASRGASPRTLDIDALRANTPGRRTLRGGVPPATPPDGCTLARDPTPQSALGSRTVDVDARLAAAPDRCTLPREPTRRSALGPRTLDVDAPLPTLHDRSRLARAAPPGEALGLRALDVDALLAAAPDRRTLPRDPPQRSAHGPHALDVDALRATETAPLQGWPRCVASLADARRLLALIEADAGAPLWAPAAPLCEIVLPATCPEDYQLAEVLYGGALLQLHPDGAEASGVAFPVTDAAALLRIVDELLSG